MLAVQQAIKRRSNSAFAAVTEPWQAPSPPEPPRRGSFFFDRSSGRTHLFAIVLNRPVVTPSPCWWSL